MRFRLAGGSPNGAGWVRFGGDGPSLVRWPAPAASEEAALPTFSPKASQIERSWHLVDADGLVLGRLATEVAGLLRGKHKPIFAPHLDTGDHVVIVNASKVVLTAGKARKKMVHRHSGYPGGLRSQTYADKLARQPEQALRDTIRGMLPKTRLGRAQIRKLKVYAGPTHPHQAQNPQPYAVDDRARALV